MKYLSTVEEFFDDAEKVGGLIRVSLAAEFLEVSSTRIWHLVNGGRFSRFFYSAQVFLSGAEVRAFYLSRREVL